MFIVFFFMFVFLVVISIAWASGIRNSKDFKDDDNELPWP